MAISNLKHSNLLVQFVSYKENEGLSIRTQGLYSTYQKVNKGVDLLNFLWA